jgi:organic hydroperoxide reductase OsmC/OhrA
MSEHRVHVTWERGGTEFGYETYPRNHRWRFEGGVEVPASAAPAFRGDPKRVDPEAAFVAALSSCHMLTFLSIASRKRLVVDAYEDDAVGFLEKNEAGRLAITRVVLRPRVRFAGIPPAAESIADLHERAHHECFVANSVRTEVAVEAR